MNFLEAVNIGRPMKRRVWQGLGFVHLVGKRLPRWKEYGTMRNVGLHARDYLAEDWEVLANEDPDRKAGSGTCLP